MDLVERPRKPAPEEVLMRWAREWTKEGVAVDWRNLLPPKGYLVLPRRWVVERTLSWIEHYRTRVRSTWITRHRYVCVRHTRRAGTCCQQWSSPNV